MTTPREPITMLTLTQAARRLRTDKTRLRKLLLSDNPPFAFERLASVTPGGRDRIRISERVLERFMEEARTIEPTESPEPGTAAWRRQEAEDLVEVLLNMEHTTFLATHLVESASRQERALDTLLRQARYFVAKMEILKPKDVLAAARRHEEAKEREQTKKRAEQRRTAAKS